MKELGTHKTFFIEVLKKFLTTLKVTNSGEDELLKAISYSLISEDAKYIRSFLILETAKMLDAKSDEMEEILKIAIAIEMVHCYSLIHDDLPCMDNSDTRRGKKTLHLAFPESTALLAGNSLLTLAFKVLSSIKNSVLAVKIISTVAEVSGIFGIMSGQVLDLNPSFKENEFEAMNYHKTGKLIQFSVLLPAIFLNASKEKMENLSTYGICLGKAYQMQDDLLDEGEDVTSYITKFGNSEILKKAINLEVKNCQNAISQFSNNQILHTLASILADRNN